MRGLRLGSCLNWIDSHLNFGAGNRTTHKVDSVSATANRRSISYRSMILAIMKPSSNPTPRKRGNPNWGKPLQIQTIPCVATEFELRAKRLGLTKEAYTASAPLRTWCVQNKNRCYIPEWLLAEWGIDVSEVIA